MPPLPSVEIFITPSEAAHLPETGFPVSFLFALAYLDFVPQSSVHPVSISSGAGMVALYGWLL